MKPSPPLPDDSIYDEMMKSEYRRRARRFWIWMAFVPAPLLVVLFWMALLLFRVRPDMEKLSLTVICLGGGWIIYCTARIADTWQTLTTELKLLGGGGLAILFALLNTALFYGLLLASCSAINHLIY
jgi:hypothetical protein